MKRFFLITFLAIASTSFAQKKIEAISFWKTGDDFQEEVSATHKGSKITWWFMNDEKQLYVRFQTANVKFQRALMSNGFTFYFDVVKQKNKENSLVFTNEMPKPESRENMQAPPNADFNQQPDRQMGKVNIEKKYTKAIWQEMPFDLTIMKTDFSASFIMDENNILTCYAIIPFRVINREGLDKIHKLSVGFEIEGSGEAKGGPGASTGNLGKNRSGGPPQGGRPPQGGAGFQGMGAPHGGGQGPYGMSMNDSGSSASKKLVTFWMLMELAYPKE